MTVPDGTKLLSENMMTWYQLDILIQNTKLFFEENGVEIVIFKMSVVFIQASKS